MLSFSSTVAIFRSYGINFCGSKEKTSFRFFLFDMYLRLTQYCTPTILGCLHQPYALFFLQLTDANHFQSINLIILINSSLRFFMRIPIQFPSLGLLIYSGNPLVCDSPLSTAWFLREGCWSTHPFAVTFPIAHQSYLQFSSSSKSTTISKSNSCISDSLLSAQHE